MKAFTEETKVLAANQGLYNGFLGAGLVFAIIEKDIKIVAFFLIFVTIAGIYGSYFTKQMIFFYTGGSSHHRFN